MQKNPEETFICKVSKVVDDYTLVLNRGSKDGIENNFRFLIYEIGEEIFDPDTKEPLGKLEVIKGIGKVTHLQEKMCTITSDQYEKSSSKTISRPILGFLNMEQVYYNEKVKLSFDSPNIGNLAKYIP